MVYASALMNVNVSKQLDDYLRLFPAREQARRLTAHRGEPPKEAGAHASPTAAAPRVKHA